MEFHKLKEIITNVIDVDPVDVIPEARFIDDLGADSLDLFQIITSIEDEFQIVINNTDLERINTVADAAMQIKNSGRGR